MSKNATITEGKRGRTFGGTERLETEQLDGTSCFWVPKDERRVDPKYVMENGDYYPDNYAMSEINVNVIDLIIDFDFNDWEITIDDFDIPHITLPDLDIDLSIDPLTGLPDVSIGGAGIDLPDVSDLMNLDDIDLSLDGADLDISGADLDGLDVDLNIDLDTLDIGLFDLPDEIRIMRVPDKTVYKDGETISLGGIVVQAYRNEEVWKDKDGKYYDGYIPAHKLSVDPKKAEYSAQPNQLVTSDLETNWEQPITIYTEVSHTRGKHSESLSGTSLVRISNMRGWSVVRVSKKPIFPASVTINNKTAYYEKNGSKAYNFSYDEWYPDVPTWLPEPDGNTIWTAVYGKIIKCIQTITVSWPRPKDHKLLTATFDIIVEEGTGTHHSGTWDDNGSGHWGGTTISGDYGGSHYSGKF